MRESAQACTRAGEAPLLYGVQQVEQRKAPPRYGHGSGGETAEARACFAPAVVKRFSSRRSFGGLVGITGFCDLI